VIEHPGRRLEQSLCHGERAGGIAREQDALGKLGCRPKMVGADVVLERHEEARRVVVAIAAAGAS